MNQFQAVSENGVTGRFMMADAEQLAFNLSAVLVEDNVAAAAAGIRVPTRLMSGGMSPYVAQRTVARLAGLMTGAHARHFPDAGHMLPKTHRDQVNADIIAHIARADELAAAGPRPCERGKLARVGTDQNLGRRNTTPELWLDPSLRTGGSSLPVCEE